MRKFKLKDMSGKNYYEYAKSRFEAIDNLSKRFNIYVYIVDDIIIQD